MLADDRNMILKKKKLLVSSCHRYTECWQWASACSLSTSLLSSGFLNTMWKCYPNRFQNSEKFSILSFCFKIFCGRSVDNSKGKISQGILLKIQKWFLKGIYILNMMMEATSYQECIWRGKIKLLELPFTFQYRSVKPANISKMDTTTAQDLISLCCSIPI